MGDLEHLLALEEQHYLLLAAPLLLEPEPANIPRRQVRTPRRYWVKPWLLGCPLFGQYENLLYELHREDSKGYQNFHRMSPELFNELVEKVGPLITKKDTFYRKARAGISEDRLPGSVLSCRSELTFPRVARYRYTFMRSHWIEMGILNCFITFQDALQAVYCLLMTS